MYTKLINRMNTTAHDFIILSLAVVCVFSFGCNDDFDDGSMAELKKPEILSIVLSPPEIAPGESTRATVLVADQRGVINDVSIFWLPEFDLDDPGGRRRTGAGSVGFESTDDLAALTQRAFELELDKDANYDFDQDGFAVHTLGLLTFTDDFDVARLLDQFEDLDLDTLLASPDIKLGFRTILVSNRENKNLNPHVKGVRCRVKDADQARGAVLVRSDDAPGEIESLRQSAVDYPIEVESEVEMTFRVTVEDDNPIEEAILYQWISTGGDFKGRREPIQKWTAPKYKKPKQNERDQRDERNVDPRLDPNLYPVWVVLRDSGIANRLGQSWAEFYVRVIPKD